LRALDELLIDFAITHPIPESLVVMSAERRMRHPAQRSCTPEPGILRSAWRRTLGATDHGMDGKFIVT